MTPLSKTESFVNKIPSLSASEKQKVKKQIFNYNVLTAALKNTYENSKNNTERNILKSIIDNNIVKKNKVKSLTTTALGLKGRARQNRKEIFRKNNTTIHEITQFYERDDVSRVTAGKNEVKSLNKNKKQRR